VEDFESGSVILDSYPDQDQNPGAWELTTSNTYEGSAYALRIYGNSWKTQSIDAIAVADSTVWQVAVYVEDLGEMQAFGLSDGTNELLYTVAGDQLPEDSKWWTVYQGAFAPGQWVAYLLPIGEDWHATHGYYPTIDTLIYVNDNDGGGGVATVFDAIVDVSEDQPVAPQVNASHVVRKVVELSASRYRAGVQFYGDVVDPDSPSHDFHWDFGDGATSAEQNPYHDFIVEADYSYAVGLVATDPDGMTGADTCQVSVEPGEGELPVTINFVGDIMIGRNYESSGGIIDTYGVDAIFEPTYPILGDAADVSYANLECPFTDQGEPHPTKSVVFRARPENIVGVANAGIDMVTLGNNHIVDYGEEGMLQTMDLLDQHGVRWSGAGVSDYFALQPSYWTERGVRMAFLGLSNRTGRRWNYQPFLDAGASKCGFAYLIAKNLEESVAATRAQADILIVQTHSGNEYQTDAPSEDDPGGAFPDFPAHGHAHGEEHFTVEANLIGPEHPDIHFRIEPLPSERALRRMALDLGADVLINHHPHVLQGFESYDGKLIAHSLGNFIFDLWYPETMPTIVLTLEVDEDGIRGYRFTPAWIDDFITHPATGMLGREIMDRLADYSRPMGALVAVDASTSEARIHLNPDAVSAELNAYQQTAPLRVEDGFAVSRPVELTGPGCLARVLDATGDGLTNYEIRAGREILWHGGFEDEGATFWDDNSNDEWLDDTEALVGARSLALRRQSSDHDPVGTDLERHLPCDPGKAHSFAGAIKTDNAEGANILARFYENRYSSNILSDTEIGPPLSGTADWLRQWWNLETPENAYYFELRATLDVPDSGEGRAWFDELKLIEWEPWQPGQPGLDLPDPNNYRFLQVRTTETEVIEVTLSYEQARYEDVLTGASGPADAAPGGRLSQNYPNPFNPSTRIELAVPAGERTPVDLAIYDVRGRRLVTLFQGELAGGTQRGFTWDGHDERGYTLPSGVYFSRARIGDRTESRKMILLK